MSGLTDILLEVLTDERQSRDELRAAIWSRYNLNVSDRSLRRAIAKLRENGYCIYASSHEKGYRIGTKADAERTAAELLSRAFKEIRAAYRLKGIELDDQERWIL